MNIFCILSLLMIFLFIHLYLLYTKITFSNNNSTETVNISFTTTPRRINKIKNTIDSYLDQDYNNINTY